MMNFTKNDVDASIDARMGMYCPELNGWALHTRAGWIAEVEVLPYREDYIPEPLYVGKCKRAESPEVAIRKACYQVLKDARGDDEVTALVREIRIALA